MNLVEGILEERDRLKLIKDIVDQETWNSNNMWFCRNSYENLLSLSKKALVGEMDINEMVELYIQMKDFKG